MMVGRRKIPVLGTGNLSTEIGGVMISSSVRPMVLTAQAPAAGKSMSKTESLLGKPNKQTIHQPGMISLNMNQEDVRAVPAFHGIHTVQPE